MMEIHLAKDRTMKKYLILSALALTFVSGCTTELSKEDRALLKSANENAREAKEQAASAAADARAAKADADRAADAAEAASSKAETSSEKADRIFRQGQNK
ncbi:hypothetical protein GC177_10405 [bacterium]|nr:hypothetical protein [bacterium]